MRWLLDAMLPPGAGAELRRLGHDSLSVLEIGMAAAEDAAETAREPVPLHLRNAITPLMKRIGYGSGYRYAHSDPKAR